ncbi:MAG: HAD family hydrolase [Sulfurimonas sp.]|uniref:HAD family hydrolase n=1 Tax=Sulfurimonas sp. TaxID=2022749 RepID=UPI0025EA42C3|nr:HAD family hydrolase [Sulfurimonas sp.]MCK9492473.1 HAD family hydrolase [Sulfurimonas sp.]
MIILFDLDGTLIDSTEAIVESFHHSFKTHNHPHPKDEQITALIGYPLDIMFADLGVEKSRVWDFVDTYRENYRKISTQKTILLQNAREAVVLASEFATLGIVTTKTGAYSKVLMEHFELMQHFEVLIGREDVEHPKPDPEPIIKALEVLGKSDENIWMIGDTKLDLISAKAAKVNSIGVLSGYDAFEALKEHTNVIFSDALEAVEYLKNK